MSIDDRIRAALAEFDSAVHAEVPTPPLGRPRRPLARLTAVAAALALVAGAVAWIEHAPDLPPVATRVAPTSTTIVTTTASLPAIVAPVDHTEYAARTGFLTDLLSPTSEALAACLGVAGDTGITGMPPELFDPLAATEGITGDLLLPDLGRIATRGFTIAEDRETSLGPCEQILTRPTADLRAARALSDLWWLWFDVLHMDATGTAIAAHNRFCLEDHGLTRPDMGHEAWLLELTRGDAAAVGRAWVACTGEYYETIGAQRVAARTHFLDEHAPEIERISALIDEALAER